MFKNRKDAGRQLAQKILESHFDISNSIILALPRGGVPVAFEIAKKLHLPLDVFLVRKLGIPGHEETAMGAITLGEVKILDKQIIDNLAISQKSIEQVLQKEQKELQYRNELYRLNAPALNFKGMKVILVDDGIATGETYSVKDFLKEAFEYAKMDWKKYVKIDKRYFRPTEVDLLLGDASKARKVLKWKPKVNFRQLVHMMVDADLEMVKRTVYGTGKKGK
jgi:adenine/guanine phosphoribosyltransferase-like PRPP-binding protein